MSGIKYILRGREVTQEEFRASSRPGRLKEMLASRVPPAARTDREFLEGHCNGSQFEKTPDLGDHYQAVARALGQSTTGKVYLSGLARFPGDPEAWVGGRGDVTRLLESRGWGATGVVNVPVRVEDPPPEVAVAEDVVQQEVEQILETLPPQERPLVDTEDLSEQVVARRKGHWCKG